MSSWKDEAVGFVRVRWADFNDHVQIVGQRRSRRFVRCSFRQVSYYNIVGSSDCSSEGDGNVKGEAVDFDGVRRVRYVRDGRCHILESTCRRSQKKKKEKNGMYYERRHLFMISKKRKKKKKRERKERRKENVSGVLFNDDGDDKT